MQWATRSASVHQSRNMRGYDDQVVHHCGNYWSSQETYCPVQPPLADEQSKQPFRCCQQCQWGNKVRNRHVLHHVHRIQVFLGDVVHRPVACEPQQQNHQRKCEDLFTADDLARGSNFGAHNSHGIDKGHHKANYKNPDFRVKLKTPRSRV